MASSRETAPWRGRGLLAASLSSRAAHTAAVVRRNARAPSRELIPPPTTAHQDTFAPFLDAASPEESLDDDRDQRRPRTLVGDYPNSDLGAPARIDSRLDCPIRAGPRGGQRCGWMPTDGTCGFRSLPRVKEHVGSHGLECTECGQVFIRHSHYTEHLNHKDDNGSCRTSRHAEQKARPYRIVYPPTVIEAIFRRISKDGRSVHDAWLDGYKVLHPRWQDDGDLPSPSFLQNTARESGTSRKSPSTGTSAYGVMRSPASPASPPSGIAEEPSYLPTSPRPLFIAGSPQNPIDLSNRGSNAIVNLWASTTNEWLRARTELPTFDQVDGNYVHAPGFSESSDLQMDGTPAIQQFFAQHTTADQMNMDPQYISPGFVEDQDPYSLGIAEPTLSVDPTALQKAPTSSTISTYEQTLSRSTTQRAPPSLQSTAASSATGDLAPHVSMKDFESLHANVNQLKTRLQKANRSNAALNHQLEDAEQQNEKLSTILDQIDQKLRRLEVSGGPYLNANGASNGIRQTMLEIRQLLNGRHSENVDMDMFADELTPTPFSQPP